MTKKVKTEPTVFALWRGSLEVGSCEVGAAHLIRCRTAYYGLIRPITVYYGQVVEKWQGIRGSRHAAPAGVSRPLRRPPIVDRSNPKQSEVSWPWPWRWQAVQRSSVKTVKNQGIIEQKVLQPFPRES
jgi:hypothetical protein